MTVTKTKLNDCFIIEPTVFGDQRGYFFESYNKANFEKEIGLNPDFIQDNEAYSTKGALRGLHFQKGEYAQAKLVRVTQGKVLDVVVDLRPDSSTFKEYISIELSAENKKQLFEIRKYELSNKNKSKYMIINSSNKFETNRAIIFNQVKKLIK